MPINDLWFVVFNADSHMTPSESMVVPSDRFNDSFDEDINADPTSVAGVRDEPDGDNLDW